MDLVFQVVALLVLLVALAALAALIVDVVRDGLGRLSWDFITGYPSRRASQAGILPALTGSVFVILLTAMLALPVGVAAAIYLEEYGRRNFVARVIELNITNLAAVPSIIYGLLGLGRVRPRDGNGTKRAWPVLPRWHCWRCRSSSCPRAKRCAPCPDRSARGRTRSAPPNGRRSGTRCCRSPRRAS